MPSAQAVCCSWRLRNSNLYIEDTYAQTGLCEAHKVRQWLKFSYRIKVFTLNLQLLSKLSSNILYEAGSELTELEEEQELV